MGTEVPRVYLAISIVQVKPLLNKKINPRVFFLVLPSLPPFSLLYLSLSLQLPLFSPFSLLLPLLSLLDFVVLLVFFRLVSLIL